MHLFYINRSHLQSAKHRRSETAHAALQALPSSACPSGFRSDSMHGCRRSLSCLPGWLLRSHQNLPSVLSTRRNRKFNTLFLHGIERTQHRIMLQLRRDHMISRKKHPLDCHIQSFRCIGRKNQPRWITASEKIAERLPRLIDHSRCSKCRTGKSPSGISQSFHGIINCIINCLRFLKRCRCVVQINHAVHPHTLAVKHIASSLLQQMDLSAIHNDFCNFFRYRRHFFFR